MPNTTERALPQGVNDFAQYKKQQRQAVSINKNKFEDSINKILIHYKQNNPAT